MGWSKANEMRHSCSPKRGNETSKRISIRGGESFADEGCEISLPNEEGDVSHKDKVLPRSVGKLARWGCESGSECKLNYLHFELSYLSLGQELIRWSPECLSFNLKFLQVFRLRL